MNQKGMNTIKLKKINKTKVYDYIYNEKITCKLDIARNLEMSISTVTQNLKTLEEDGLINKNGFFDSTGGRKADAVEITKNAKISIGIAILKNSFDVVAINLYGETLYSSTILLEYNQNKEYFQKLGEFINEFIDDKSIDKETILGISIAIQGVVSNNGEYVTYGKILDNLEMKLEDFVEFINYPCRIEHDSKSAGRLEIWENKDIENAIVLLLNLNLGSAIITNRTVQNGDNMRSGIIEHIGLAPNEYTCYCGKNGCFETYCSANALKKMSNMNLDEFFKSVEKNNENSIKIWEQYLDKLAYVISNLNLIIDGKIILSGTISLFIGELDKNYLIDKINNYAIFPFEHKDIIISKRGNFTQSIGSALFYIEKFLRFE